MSVLIPDQLRKSMAEGNTVLFVGAGMSRPHLPGWSDLLRQMLVWARSNSISLDEKEIDELIRDGDLLLAAQELRSRFGESNFRQFIKKIFRDPNLKPGPAHKLLPDMGFAAVLTTNYDKLIETTFPAGTPFHTQLDYP